MYIRNYFLKQPRRGKTREAQVTPHKRSAVWGLMLETGSDCGDSDTGERSAIRVCLSLVIVVLLALASPLSAQHRDTLYVVEEDLRARHAASARHVGPDADGQKPTRKTEIKSQLLSCSWGGLCPSALCDGV